MEGTSLASSSLNREIIISKDSCAQSSKKTVPADLYIKKVHTF